MSAGARRIEKRVPDGLAGALKRTCSAIFFRAARTPLSEGRNGQSGRAETYHGEIGNAREVLAVVIAPACPRLRAFFLKFSRIAPGLQSDAETDGLHAARLFYAHNEKARGHSARRCGVSRVLSEPGGLRVPQQQIDAGWRTGAGCGDISRETATTPAQYKAKAAREVHLRRAESLLRRRQRRLRAACQENSCK